MYINPDLPVVDRDFIWGSVKQGTCGRGRETWDALAASHNRLTRRHPIEKEYAAVIFAQGALKLPYPYNRPRAGAGEAMIPA